MVGMRPTYALATARPERVLPMFLRHSIFPNFRYKKNFMNNTNTALALIPARGGSKGIPHKNIYTIAGKPLIAWSIEAAKGCPAISRIIVSSDDDEILTVAKKWGAEPLKRSAELAADKSRSEPVVTHALQILEKE